MDRLVLRSLDRTRQIEMNRDRVPSEITASRRSAGDSIGVYSRTSAPFEAWDVTAPVGLWRMGGLPRLGPSGPVKLTCISHLRGEIP